MRVFASLGIYRWQHGAEQACNNMYNVYIRKSHICQIYPFCPVSIGMSLCTKKSASKNHSYMRIAIEKVSDDPPRTNFYLISFKNL